MSLSPLKSDDKEDADEPEFPEMDTEESQGVFVVVVVVSISVVSGTETVTVQVDQMRSA
jgi:hypothetical protein